MDISAGETYSLMTVISNILVFFGIAGVIVPLLQRLKISSILGYLICGIVVGPSGLSLLAGTYPWLSYITIQETHTVHLLGELGIITLMFMIGLELSFARLKELRRYIFGLGTAQILVTGLIIFGIAYAFGNKLEASILLGACFALSSTAIVIKLLEDRKLSNRPVGTISFAILLMQDLAVVPILVLATSFSGESQTGIATAMATSLGLGIVTVISIYILGKKVFTPLLQSVSFSNSPEWLAAFVVFIVIGCSALTYGAGLSLALGAFMAGLLIAETEFKHEVEVIVSPMKGFLIGIFFLSVGMMINFAEMMRYPALLAMSVVGIYVFKTAVILPLCLAFRIPVHKAVQVAIYLAQPGEFALLILGIAMASNLMPPEHVQFFLLVTVLSMIFTPLFSRLAPLASHYAQSLFDQKEKADDASSTDERQRVLIAGFGRVGQLVGKVLEEQWIPYTAFDMDGRRVQTLKKQGFNIIYGDARKKQLWHHLINENIGIAIIAIDDYKATQHILKSLRAEFPLLPVIVRSKDTEHSTLLYTKGATHVVAETLESSLRIAQLLTSKLGIPAEETRLTLEKIRLQNIH